MTVFYVNVLKKVTQVSKFSHALTIKANWKYELFLSCWYAQKKYKSCHWGCTFSKGTLLLVP